MTVAPLSLGIDLGELRPNRYDFDTFMSEHVRNEQGNVVIAFDDLTITLLGLRKSELSYEDFNY